MDIKCRKTTCVYNDGLVCQKKEIDIGKEAHCNSFKKNENKKPIDTSAKIFIKKVEYAPFVHCKNCCIKCKAKCLFNRKLECFANGIVINDVNERAKCITHLE